MAYNKVDFSLPMSKETITRFGEITDAMNLTNEQTIIYLLDLHDKVGPRRDGLPEKRPTESRLHTCVRPEIKAKFRQLAGEYGLNSDQLLRILIDMHDQCPGCASGPAEQQTGAEAPVAESAPVAKGPDRDPMSKLEAALAMIRDAFLSATSESEEVKTLREQLAKSQAETRKVKDAYQEMLQTITARLQDLA